MGEGMDEEGGNVDLDLVKWWSTPVSSIPISRSHSGSG